MARLKDHYNDQVRAQLVDKFSYSTPMQAPKLVKVTLNMGVGEAKQDSKQLEAAKAQLADIAGQQPNIRRARKSVANFKLREGMPVGLTVTLRDQKAYEFLDRLISVAIPRLRDFRGLNPKSFDGRGNYNTGIKEHVIFPEIDYDTVDAVRGFDIAITTTAKTDAEAFTLLDALGLPFARDGRPKQYESLRGSESVAA
jgi:large subunit ribosomal protein L5